MYFGYLEYLRCTESKVLAQMLVALELLHNHIQSIGTNAKIRFRKRDKIFAVVRINPRTVLEPHESIFLHKHTQTIANATAAFWNIEEHHTPTTIPTFRFFSTFFSHRFKFKHLLSRFGHARIPLAVSLLKSNQTFGFQTTKRRLRLIIKSCALFVAGHKAK